MSDTVLWDEIVDNPIIKGCIRLRVQKGCRVKTVCKQYYVIFLVCNHATRKCVGWMDV